MSKREKNLLDLWKAKIKKSRVEINLISDSDEEQSTNIDADHAGGETVTMSGEKIHAASSYDSDKSCDKLGNEESHQAVTTVLMEENSSHCSAAAAAAGGLDSEAADESFSHSNAQPSALPLSETEVCQSLCCSDIIKPFHPTDAKTVFSLANNKRNFMTHWYQTYPWLSVCTTKRKVFCCYCRYAEKLNMLNFSKRGEDTFTTSGFNKWKKALEKFKRHSLSITHREAVMKCHQLQKAPIDSTLNLQVQKTQASRRNALLKQLDAIKFLLRQGLAFRGHDEFEGNLHQLLVMLSRDNGDVKTWISEKKYISHDIINDQISIFANTLLRSLLLRITKNAPSWYSIIGDEATDVAKREQFNLSIRWVNNDYDIAEDPIGLYCLLNTTADTLYKVIKDILIRCSLPLSLCRGQAYDGAANMQGKRTGVATRMLKKNPTALPVHCLAHSLNLCLQDAGRQVQLLRDALDVVKEISQLIKFSPKRSHMFSEKLQQCDSSSSGVNSKLLCLTRWTARHGAFEAVLKDYSILMETMEENSETSHDEYGVKAKGILTLMEKFSTFFGIELGYLIFGPAEALSNTLQCKDTSFQEAMAAVTLAKSFYKRIRKEEECNRFYDRIVRKSVTAKIDSPCLPRYRRAPKRIDSGSSPHQFTTP
ncbi:zinc finger MYM-type protein 1-like [Dysidea avara]|uniref:zinc finger MYM-type protein 1-like n=1 Tax=Dysidea avara TaxID=196820 RepID=UPI00331DE4F6